MKEEIEAAASFLTKIVTKKLSTLTSEQADQFRDNLSSALHSRYQDHWFPDEPSKGQAYRCIRLNESNRCDPILNLTCLQSGINYSDLQLPLELTLWVDPSEVTCRFGEHRGSHCTLARFRDGEMQENSIDEIDIDSYDKQNIERIRQSSLDMAKTNRATSFTRCDSLSSPSRLVAAATATSACKIINHHPVPPSPMYKNPTTNGDNYAHYPQHVVNVQNQSLSTSPSGLYTASLLGLTNATANMSMQQPPASSTPTIQHNGLNGQLNSYSSNGNSKNGSNASSNTNSNNSSPLIAPDATNYQQNGQTRVMALNPQDYYALACQQQQQTNYVSSSRGSSPPTHNNNNNIMKYIHTLSPSRQQQQQANVIDSFGMFSSYANDLQMNIPYGYGRIAYRRAPNTQPRLKI